MKREPKYKCVICGKPVHDPPTVGLGRCRACYMAEKKKANRLKWEEEAKQPPACAVCGKPIPNWSHKKALIGTKTCSRACTAKLTQLHITTRESKEAQIARIVAGIKAAGEYLSAEKIRARFHVGIGKHSKHGMTATELNALAGYHLYEGRVANRDELTYDVVRDKYKQLLIEDHGISIRQAAKKLGVSVDYIQTTLKISPADIRAELGLAFGKSKTKEELETEILAWLKQQPCYCSAMAVAAGIGVDYSDTIRAKGINIAELNARAGHIYSNTSYCEDYAYALLYKAGFRIVRQKTFPECRDTYVLRFDFWLPDYNVLIETDGELHYEPTSMQYEKRHKADLIKEAYAKANNIPLFRVREKPIKTYQQRIAALIEQIKGLPRVNVEVHTDSNCGELLPGNAEDNPQPSQEA